MDSFPHGLVWRAGFRVQGAAGCRVQGSEFRVQGSELRVEGSGFRSSGLWSGSAGCQ